MPLHVSSACAHQQEVKIALRSLWYHHTYRRDVFRAHVLVIRRIKTALRSLWYHHTYRCDDTRGCVMQF